MLRSQTLLPGILFVLGCGASPAVSGGDASASPPDAPRVDVAAADAGAQPDAPTDRGAATDAPVDLCVVGCRLISMARCNPDANSATAERSCVEGCRREEVNNPSCRAASEAYQRCAVAAGVPMCREGQPFWPGCAALEAALNACVIMSNADAGGAPADAVTPPGDAPEDIAETVSRCTDVCAAQRGAMCTNFEFDSCVSTCREQVIFVSPQCRAQHRARADCRAGATYTCSVVNTPSTSACDAQAEAVVTCERGDVDGGS